MAVRWDSLLLATMVRELGAELRGARVRSIRLDHRSRDVVLYLRESVLVLRLHPTRGTIARLPPEEPPPGSRPFASRIRDVTAPADERYFRIQLLRRRGRSRGMDLVVELIPNRWNAYLVETSSGVIRHVLHQPRKGEAARAPGSPYQPPEPSGRLGAEEPVPLDRWLSALEPVPPEDRPRALLSTFAYTSRLNAPFLLEIGDLREGWERWSRVRSLPPTEAVILRTGKGPQPYPYPLPPLPSERRESLLDAFSEVGGGGADAREALLPSELVEALTSEVERAEGKLRQLERELETAEDPAPLRALGDLILARFHEIPRGATEAVLQDFEGREVTVDLDPSLAPNENAARQYDRAARAERARQRLPEMIGQARRRLERRKAALARLRAGEVSAEELEELAGATGARGRPGQARKGTERGPTLPYRRYRSSGGLEIRVGRGSSSNDALTFHHSRPDDVWLHARQAAGAHVILRWDGDGKPPRRDLVEAATLAALHSRARGSGTVPVDWTRRKYVRKPRKAPPGAVTPDRVETVFVEPLEEVEERLRDEE